MKLDFLIIGQGLAGSLLAKTLIEHEQNVTLVDNVSLQSASRVAAGIINPLTGQRMVVSSEVRQCLPVAVERYRSLAKQFNKTFYVERPMLRLFNDISDRDRFHSRSGDEEYREYLGDEFSAGNSGEPVKDLFGGFAQKRVGQLNIQLLLETLREFFKENAVYTEGTVDNSSLEILNGGVNWNGQNFDHVIFCDGARAVNNKWFRWLPFQLSKGELISVNSGSLLPTSIINKGYWLLPLDQHEAIVGASYTWDWQDEQPTSSAKQELITFAENILSESDTLTVTAHQSGIRPTTKDKQPFMGTHPQYSQVHCFNGFGSKGGMLIPHYVNCLVDNLLNNKPLPPAVDIARFQDEKSLTVVASRFMSENIAAGDIVIDATVGNGHDTELLARCVEESGHVYGFDIQQQAIDNARRRLIRGGISKQVALIQGSHAFMLRQIDGDIKGKVSTVVFNLGYLPGADKKSTTLADTTLQALNDAANIIKPGGFIMVMTYSGHASGKNETEAVQLWATNLNKTKFTCRMIGVAKKIEAPLLFIITKTKN